MEETRIDRLEVWFDELAAEIRSGFRAIDARLCKVESRLDQTATKAEVSALEARIGQVETCLLQCATKSELSDLRNEMYRMNAELKGWMLATTLTIIASSLAIQHWSG
jgi:hypothetical protein